MPVAPERDTGPTGQLVQLEASRIVELGIVVEIQRDRSA